MPLQPSSQGGLRWSDKSSPPAAAEEVSKAGVVVFGLRVTGSTKEQPPSYAKATVGKARSPSFHHLFSKKHYLHFVILPHFYQMQERIQNKTSFRKLRKDLRNNGTSAEAALWLQLKGKQLHNKKFRRQQSIESFIVDFYCASEKLIIELDGDAHWDVVTEDNDVLRDKRLKELGFTVLRFENKIVFENMDHVLEEIGRWLQKLPSCEGGERCVARGWLFFGIRKLRTSSDTKKQPPASLRRLPSFAGGQLITNSPS